jgi:hypothetical protein
VDLGVDMDTDGYRWIQMDTKDRREVFRTEEAQIDFNLTNSFIYINKNRISEFLRAMAIFIYRILDAYGRVVDFFAKIIKLEYFIPHSY